MTTETISISVNRDFVINTLHGACDYGNNMWFFSNNGGWFLGVDFDGCFQKKFEWSERGYNENPCNNFNICLCITDFIDEEFSPGADITDYFDGWKFYRERDENQEYQNYLEENEEEDDDSKFKDFLIENNQKKYEEIYEIMNESMKGFVSDYLLNEIKVKKVYENIDDSQRNIDADDNTVIINWV